MHQIAKVVGENTEIWQQCNYNFHTATTTKIRSINLKNSLENVIYTREYNLKKKCLCFNPD